jgi:DNA-binding response OmpR family regulator
MRRLLLVEDSIELADNFAELVSEANFEAHVVHSAEEAERLLAHEPFDVVLSDLRLPNQSGVELVRNLRNGGIDVPVILMSAFANETARAAAYKLGVVSVLVKPVDCAQLLSMLTSLPETPQQLRATAQSQKDSRINPRE